MFKKLTFLMLSALILTYCATLILYIPLLWQPIYWLGVISQLMTVALSITVAFYVIHLLPQALHRFSQAELSLKASEHKLEILSKQLTTLIETIPDIILLKDAAGCWLFANDYAKRFFKLHDIAWQGKTDSELALLHPELRAMHDNCLTGDEAVWTAQHAVVTDTLVIDDDGYFREFELHKAPFFNSNGERKGLVMVGRDITDRTLTDQELRIAAIAIESQEAILITDATNRILRVNNAFTQLTGYSAAEVIGKSPAMLRSDRHDTAFYKAMWDKLLLEKYWQGEVWDRRKNGVVYPKWLTITAVSNPNGQITNYVGAFTDLSEHKEAQAAINQLAFYDPLTNLPNRRLLADRLRQAMTISAGNQIYCALLLIDLDNFKVINDTQGHGVGDELLTDVAYRLIGCVRQGDTVARLGGDEFVVMLQNLHTECDKAAAQTHVVGEKILKALNEPYTLGNYEHHGSGSIGISLFAGNHITHYEIVKHADLAMYEAKRAGRNTMRFFDPGMQALLETRTNLELELRQALKKQQFKLHYQAQIDCANGILGAEVLLRWLHPQLGLIAPAQFIPIAEETGLILPIGAWVLRMACLQLTLWANSPLTKNLQLAVNVSARQFSQPDFVERMLRILEETGADASLLKLELTESLVMDNVDETIKKMTQLKLFGIRFSMDDFGTGYSSLSYLKKLPLSQLKIDQSFIRDLMTDTNDAIIIQTIIGMATNLGLNVIAEGVETEAQRACLEHLGCPTYQGYLFSKPVPVEAFEALLALPVAMMQT